MPIDVRSFARIEEAQPGSSLEIEGGIFGEVSRSEDNFSFSLCPVGRDIKNCRPNSQVHVNFKTSPNHQLCSDLENARKAGKRVLVGGVYTLQDRSDICLGRIDATLVAPLPYG